MGGLMVSLLAAIVAGFFATLALAPRLPELKLQDPRILSALHDRNAKRLNHKAAWARVPKPGPGRAVG